MKAGIVQAHVFVGENEEYIVAWTYPPKNASIRLSELEISPSEVVRVLDADGTPLPLKGGEVLATPDPIHFKRVGFMCSAPERRSVASCSSLLSFQRLLHPLCE